jgi:hypothetical protein
MDLVDRAEQVAAAQSQCDRGIIGNTSRGQARPAGVLDGSGDSLLVLSGQSFTTASC